MSLFSWMFIAALLDEYSHIFLGILIGLPLCFFNPILGVVIGIAVAYGATWFRTGG